MCMCMCMCPACTPRAHCTWQFAGHTSDCLCLSVAPDGPPKIFATGGLDNTVLRLLRLRLPWLYHIMHHAMRYLMSHAIRHAMDRIMRHLMHHLVSHVPAAAAVGHAWLCHLFITPQVRLWDISSGKCVRTFLAKSEVNAICKQYSVGCFVALGHATCRTNSRRAGLYLSPARN